MLKLKLIPRFARLLLRPSAQPGKFLCRSFATAGGDGDDGDFFTQYLSEGPATDDRTQQNRRPSPNSGFGRRGPRFGGPMGGGRGGGPMGSGRGGGFMGRGGRGGRGGASRPGPRGYGDRFRPDDIDDEHLAAPVAITEEDLKLKQELDQKRAESGTAEKKTDEAEEDEEEEEEVKSIYTGFIDPKYDDVIKDHKMQLKRLRYKDKAFIPSKFAGEDDEEDLSYLDRDSSDDEKKKKGRGRGRAGAVDAKGQAVTVWDGGESGSEDEVDEEEWEHMNDMDNQEFERHLKHRAHAKQLRKEYEARIEALGEKAEDLEEIKKVQKLMMKKWRAHYLMPRMVTPKEKEEMWEKHKNDPEEWTVEKLADEYNVCKARVHAILFLWDIRKQGGERRTAEEETKVYLDSLCFDESGKPCLPPHMGEDKWVTTWNTKPNYKIMPADWEGSVRTEEEAIEEASAKEEAMMLEEFVRRLEFNKLQMAGLMKQHRHARRRPPGGWTYLIEKLGPEGKRGKRGGIKFVATADGKHRKLNDLEKLVLKREAVRPRKRVL